MVRRDLTALVVAALVALPAGAQPPDVRFAGFTVYGTDLFDAESLAVEFAPVADALLEHLKTGDFANLEQGGEEILKPMRTALDGRAGLALVDVAVIVGGTGNELTMAITVDAVEEADRARRMPFRDAPTGEYEDPDGVFDAWLRYEEAAFGMMMSGELFD